MLFWDDQAANVEAAARAGLHAILYQSPEQLQDEMTALAFTRAPAP
ncbi:MAG: hypothetical protein M0Z54_08450 [Thermaerobacter sp.]|nr:hypothetical protein [Thermaerobacter sp.]